MLQIVTERATSRVKIIQEANLGHSAFYNYYGFQTVCKCPFWSLLVTLVTDSNQTWAN